MATALRAEVYVICITIVSLLLGWMVKKESKSASERWLHGAFIAFLCNFAAGLLFTVFDDASLNLPLRIPLSYAFKMIEHISLCTGVFAWCGYAETERRSTLFQNKKTLRLLALSLVLLAAAILSNPWTHWLFTIDADGAYTHGFLYHLEMALLLAGSLVVGGRMLWHMMFESDPISKTHYRQILTFPVCILASWALFKVNKVLPVICVFITIELLCLYVGTSTRQISLDKLTQLNNRQNLMGFMDYKLLNHDEKLFLLMIDVDYFKTINDTYGHLVGDDALICIANVLKKACGPFARRPYIARYGGDEFMIVLEGSRQELEQLLSGIHALLDEVNTQSGHPYTLSLSIGVGDWMPGMTPNDFIAAADNDLYEIKRNRPAH